MKIISLLSFAGAFCLLSPAHSQDQGSLVLSKTIPLPGIQGSFNHMSVDSGHQRLFVTATTKKTLEIIDLKSGEPRRSLAGDGPAAALFAPEFNQLYVTRGHSLCIYDGSTFDLLTSVDLQSGLDELQCDPIAKRLYVGCMTSNKTAIAIIGIPDRKPIGKINLPAKPQGFVVEQKGTRIFANIPSLKQIAVLDRDKQTLLAPWPLNDVSGNYPIALDEPNHRLFIGCRRPAQLVVFDTTTAHQVAAVSIAADTDDLAYDPTRKRIYVACGDGSVDVIDQRDADHYQLREHISVPPGSRNSVFSAESNQFYLAVPQRGNQPAEIRVFQSQ
jgi:DNA-binding beta-propeller fold protein YncE